MPDSRIPGLYRLGISERIGELVRRGWLTDATAASLRDGRHVLQVAAADKMIENVIASFALPLAIAPNFKINDRDYIVPLVVEEPSIVAALSAAASLARKNGGFRASVAESLLIGQVHIREVADVAAAKQNIQAAREQLLGQANAMHPRLVKRGGGACDIEVREITLASGESTLSVNLLVDTCDAMGANLVNTMCEAVAPGIADLAGGKVVMSILSNLADRSVVTAEVCIACSDLGASDAEGEATRDAIVLADEIAAADPYRAATHNKGIMNGIDPLAIATGNDWRAIEAGAHAWAARSGQYRALTNWSVADNGDLQGRIELPLKVGIVGGTLDTNPAARIGLDLCAVASATELAQLMAVVGLAQNFAALRALATTGIQKGHMRLHARSVAAAAGVPDELFDEIVSALVEDGEVKEWKARELLVGKRRAGAADSSATVSGEGRSAGKVILLGEHAVVYGKHALALPIENAVTATVSKGTPSPSELDAGIALIAGELGIDTSGYAVSVTSLLPRAMGLGSSAAIAVAIIRAFDQAFDLGLDNERINAVAFECEKLAHGTPSGVDNSIACFGDPLLFRNTGELELTPLSLTEPPPIVIACSSSRGLTVEQVQGVRTRYEHSPERYGSIFDDIDALALDGAEALRNADYDRLGASMNICHGLLNALMVSTPELESMLAMMRSAGAVGAKLTGAGGGGSVVALCPGTEREVSASMRMAGYQTIRLNPDKAEDNE